MFSMNYTLLKWDENVICLSSCCQIFKTPPDGTDPSESRILPSNNNPSVLRPHINTGGAGAKHSEPIPRPVSSIAAIGRNANHSSNPPSRIYANQAPVHPHSGARTKQRPVQIFNANTGGEICNMDNISVVFIVSERPWCICLHFFS